jgi:hypothetical protein
MHNACLAQNATKPKDMLWVLVFAGCLEVEPWAVKAGLADLVLFRFWFDSVSSTMLDHKLLSSLRE